MDNSGGLLAPPPTTATATKDMNSDNSGSPSSPVPSESGGSSSNSSFSDSPSAASSDPLSFLMDPVAGDKFWSSDSSAEESSLTSSTPPSSHDSLAGDWSASSKDSAAAMWSQPDLSSMSFDNFSAMDLMNFDPTSLNMFDPMLFSDETLGLSLDSMASGQSDGAHSDLSSFAFSFGSEGFADLTVPSDDSGSRRLSITSSSSSGASLSPVMDHAQASPVSAPAQPVSPSLGQPQLSGDQMMDELAKLARQIVGVTMALPAGVDTANGSQPQSDKLPIPRLLPGAPKNDKRESSVASTSSASSSSPPVNGFSPAVTPAPTTARTKTSHTTIERRYRTNLNARIQSLRAAVPALRVLEHKPGNRVGNLPLKAGTRRAGVNADAGAAGEEEDVIDERGFVDGVKVARKGSKANVLGKAVEYIRVLKRRELRLKREQEGLKALVRSLVGGPALVKEWETMWRERFGGSEKDEVEGEDGEADDENDDGEEDDDVEDKEEGDDESGKKRKRAKVEASASNSKGKTKKVTTQAIQPVPIMPAQPFPANPAGVAFLPVPIQPEKRKRGRPRKIPLPPMPVPNTLVQGVFAAQQSQQQASLMTAPPSNEVKMEVDGTATSQSGSTTPLGTPAQNQTPQPGRYLLAAFAFFSFFNSPVSFSAPSWGSRHAAHEHTHVGSVLGDPRPETVAGAWSDAPSVTFGWRDAVQIVHIAVSFLLLVSIVAPWFPRVTRGRISRLVPSSLKPILGGPLFAHSDAYSHARTTRPRRSSVADDESGSEEEKVDASARMVLLEALRSGREVPPAEEAQILREALGLGTGVLGLIMSMTRQVGSPTKSRSRFGLERRMLEQRAFLRLAELIALDASAPITTRIQTYLYAFKFFSIFSASATDISTLALVIRPVWRSKATTMWSLALRRAQGKGSLSPHISRTFEAFVLENMTVDEAAQKIAKMDLNTVARARRASFVAGDASESDEDDEGGRREPASPLAVLASGAIRDYVREQVELAFLQTVPGDVDCEPAFGGDADAADRQMQRVVAAGCSLDSQTAELVDLFERVCNPTSAYFAHPAALGESEVVGTETAVETRGHGDEELRALLRAVVLYRRIFPSTLLSVPAGDNDASSCARRTSGGMSPLPPPPPSSHSNSNSISIALTPMLTPPPSPSRRNAALHLALRRCLDSAAFDRRDALEDARDRVVDMLTAEAAVWPARLQY
ncbi:hypothetical protein M0805_001827 [Coniferiporia weirii]|nr:hypothetical protein M0805_001827 [Coniferiporia weirii]